MIRIQSPHPDVILATAVQPEAMRRKVALQVSPSPARKGERALGRAAAYKALRDLGIESPPTVESGERGMPLWPDGVVGSISHASGAAVAAVAWTDKVRFLGIDLQPVRPLKCDIAPRICSKSELAWCGEAPDLRLVRTLLLFSAKESIFKALYPSVRRFFGFLAAELTWTEHSYPSGLPSGSPLAPGFQAVLTEDLGGDFVRGMQFPVSATVLDAQSGLLPEAVFASVVLLPGKDARRSQSNRKELSGTRH